jgi:hypothetical protein
MPPACAARVAAPPFVVIAPAALSLTGPHLPPDAPPDPLADPASPPRLEGPSDAPLGAAEPPELGETAERPTPGGLDGTVGRPLGCYRVYRRIGAGGFARVYRADDPELDLAVAVKLLRPELAATRSSSSASGARR